MFNTRIRAKVEICAFLDRIKKYKEEQIDCTEHTFFRLNEAQRKIYTYKELTRILFKETPFLVGIQFNDNYAVFYHYKNKVLKIILSIGDRKINIVTFYFIEEWQIPEI